MTDINTTARRREALDELDLIASRVDALYAQLAALAAATDRCWSAVTWDERLENEPLAVTRSRSAWLRIERAARDAIG